MDDVGRLRKDYEEMQRLLPQWDAGVRDFVGYLKEAEAKEVEIRASRGLPWSGKSRRRYRRLLGLVRSSLYFKVPRA